MTMLAMTLTFAMTLASLASPAAPEAKAKHAALTSVESRVASKKLAIVDPKAVVRSDLERELALIDWKQEGVKAPFELSAVLAAAESTADKKGATASCVIEVVLREPNGKILGTVRGRASGEEAKGSREALERGVSTRPPRPRAPRSRKPCAAHATPSSEGAPATSSCRSAWPSPSGMGSRSGSGCSTG
jgi:hypothetical protein